MKLNIGGLRTIHVSKTTLLSEPTCLLSKAFSGNHKLQMIGDAYFIDSDPEVFLMVINYLRYRELPDNLEGAKSRML